MAISSICATLNNGLDFTCISNNPRKYYQQLVLINSTDIDTTTIIKQILDTPTCKHNITFQLKTGKTGYRLSLPENGGSIFGSFDKTTNELTGSPQYIHKVNYAVVGISEDVKCFLRSLDKGSFVVVGQLKDGTVEVYGIDNGLQNADYTFDIVGGNGGTAIVLQSLEQSPESQIPFVYTSLDPNADFDSNFANP